MRVWLINPDEDLPSDGPSIRLRRTGLVAAELAARGHDVLWWNSTFRHMIRKQRFDREAVTQVAPNYRVRFLRAPGYRRSISLRRMWNNVRLAQQFARQAALEAPPDVILTSYPTIELSYEAVRYGERAGVPVVVDLRDMWPDMFLFHAPRWARPAGRLALAPLFRMARYTCARAHALTGHTAEFVAWGQRLGGRAVSPRDRSFPHGYPKPSLRDDEFSGAAAFWQRHGLVDEQPTKVICFFGGVGHALDFGPVIEAARMLRDRRDLRFVLCGDGSRLDALRRLAGTLPNVLIPGFVGVPEIEWLMKRSVAGLAPWKPTPDYEATISNKVVEYWSAGLPVLTSLSRGVLVALFAEHDCGMSYGGDAARLRDAIRGLIAEPARRESMGRQASALFEERFAAGKVYGEMAEHLQRLVDGYSNTLGRAA